MGYGPTTAAGILLVTLGLVVGVIAGVRGVWISVVFSLALIGFGVYAVMRAKRLRDQGFG